MISEADLVSRYLALRAKQKELKAEVAKYQAALDKIESHFLGRLAEQQAQNIKFETGLVYKSTVMQTKLVDRPKLIGFVREIPDARGFDIFTNSLSKEFVREYLEQNNSTPPGVEVSYYTNVNIRKD
jgi:hypothetical protein